MIRHCMSFSCPDGMECGYVARERESPFQNHLYGTFTAAKEKMWLRVAPGVPSISVLEGPASPDNAMAKAHKKKRQNKRRRRPRGGSPRVGTTVSVNPSPVELDHAYWHKEDLDNGGRYKIPRKLQK